jgi:hypothetical protein
MGNTKLMKASTSLVLKTAMLLLNIVMAGIVLEESALEIIVKLFLGLSFFLAIDALIDYRKEKP